MTEHRAQVDELLADYRRSRDQLATVQRNLAAISESASDPAGVVTVTVGPRGTLTGLKISDDAYRRYSAAELAQQILTATATATVRAFEGAGEVLAPVLPSGTDPQALLFGTADLRADEVTPVREEESFEEQSWIEEREWPTAR